MCRDCVACSSPGFEYISPAYFLSSPLRLFFICVEHHGNFKKRKSTKCFNQGLKDVLHKKVDISPKDPFVFASSLSALAKGKSLSVTDGDCFQLSPSFLQSLRPLGHRFPSYVSSLAFQFLFLEAAQKYTQFN